MFALPATRHASDIVVHAPRTFLVVSFVPSSLVPCSFEHA